MKENLTINDLIIEEHPGGQNCSSCPFSTLHSEHDCPLNGHELEDYIDCFTHTITLKPTPDEHI